MHCCLIYYWLSDLAFFNRQNKIILQTIYLRISTKPINLLLFSPERDVKSKHKFRHNSGSGIPILAKTIPYVFTSVRAIHV